MRSDEMGEIRQLPIFVGVDTAHVDAMLKASFLQRFPAHVELAREGDPADFLHVIIDGQIEVYSAWRDRETTVSVLGPGSSFIVAAVILDRVYLKSARALVPSRVLLVPAEAVRNYFLTDAAFSRALAIEIASAYRGVVKELKNQKLRSSQERLANWILSQSANAGSDRFELPFDKKILASRLGMVPEVLSRSFAALSACSVIVNGRTIKIGDHDALRKLAHPCATIDDPDS